MRIRFLPDNIAVEAQPGEPMLAVANRARVSIPTGCLMGSCHACEVEVDGGDIICACISSIPSGREEMTVQLYVDPTW
ncbi:MAG: 2Fe-2S iron-sulfur cluster-binding protein [Microcoleaceae cyanobacterium]